jgi:hypothetical protein
MKHTYRHFIGNDEYHTFKNRMVYNAMYCLMHDDRAMLRIYKERYLVCLKNKSLIKMFFSVFDTIDTIRIKIETLENNIKKNYLYL